jgi:hypothetical protein
MQWRQCFCVDVITRHRRRRGQLSIRVGCLHDDPYKSRIDYTLCTAN